MWYSPKRFVFHLCALGLGMQMLLPIAEGQTDNDSGRAGLTGQQLFEHQWTPVEESSQRVNRSGNVVLGDGLGPLHNATSCAECHVAGGGSGVQHNVTMITVDPRSSLTHGQAHSGNQVLKVFPGLLGPDGQMTFSTVVHDRSTRDGYGAIRRRLADYVPGGIDEQWFTPKSRTSSAIANQPVVAGRHASVDFYLSQRNSPALFGLGVIDSIGLSRLNAVAQHQAEQSNGRITGRVAGKFGWKGQLPTLSSFVIQACAGELGLNQSTGMTSRRIPTTRLRTPSRRQNAMIMASQAGDPADLSYINIGSDMELDEVQKLAKFVAAIPRPIERIGDGHTFEEVLRGEKVFASVGCSDCHLPDMHPVSGMFTDLLLHDMGSKLRSPSPAPVGPIPKNITVVSAPKFPVKGPRSLSASPAFYGNSAGSSPSENFPKPPDMERPDTPRFATSEASTSPDAHQVPSQYSWNALQREWRTPPLWGIADTAPYLHDGRAATLEEAIVWHGGEAEDSRRAFSKLTRADKDSMLLFLSTLRAPELPKLPELSKSDG